MDTLNKHGVVVFFKAVRDSGVHSRRNDIRKFEGNTADPFPARIVKNLSTILFKFGGFAVVFGKAMQVNLDTSPVQCDDLMIDVEHPSIVNRIRNDE